MNRVIGIMLCGVLCALSGWAQDGDVFMGTYEGNIRSSGGDTVPVTVDVIADSRTRYTLVFHAGDERAEVKGRKPNVKDDDAEAAAKAVKVTIDDILELSDALGGAGKLEAVIEGSMLKGTLDSKEPKKLEAKKVDHSSPTLGAAAPEGAILLFDGSNLDRWTRWPEKWCLTGDGGMQVCGSNFATKDEFGSAQWHVEFRTPFMPNERGQGRGNSGVYIQGRYEVQVLDSFGLKPADDLCGGIYKIAVPSENACLPPLQWQTYDITFHAPELDSAGKVTKNARITVVQNGITIHDDLELPHPTPGGISGDAAATGPLMLQDHGNEVRYRNIWVKPLD